MADFKQLYGKQITVLESNLRNYICKKCTSIIQQHLVDAVIFGSCRLKTNQLFPGINILQTLQTQFCNSPQCVLVRINEIPGHSSQKEN